MDQRAHIGQVLHPRDRGLGTQRRPGLGAALQGQLEAGIVPRSGGIVSVLISCGNHHDPEAHDLGQVVLNLGRITRINHARSKTLCQTCLTLDLAQQGQPGIRTHVRAIKTKQDWLAIHR